MDNPSKPPKITMNDQTRLAKLAREVVMNIRELPETLAAFNITEAEYEKIKENPFFKKAHEHISIEWNSAISGPERARLIAAAMLEEAFPVMGGRMLDQNESLNAVVETGKLFAKIAGIGEAKTTAPTGERFSITINLGADEKLKLESTHPEPIQIEASPLLLETKKEET